MLLNPSMHLPSRFANVHFSAFARNLLGILYTTPSCFRGLTASTGHAKCDLSVVSDLKTGRMPCCCRKLRKGSHNCEFSDSSRVERLDKPRFLNSSRTQRVDDSWIVAASN